VATLDKDFQDRRRIAKVRNTPRHAVSGLSQGIKSLADGVGSGVVGLVQQPIVGAEREGVGGFFKGIGKGLIG
jgi:vacuolar protein sorting-associated protein 13A/C